MPISERAEELLEIIWTTAEKSQVPVHSSQSYLLGKESASVHDEELLPDSLDELEQNKFIERRGEEVRFTAAGLQAATCLIRRHRLAERLITDVLNMRGDIIDEYACRFEHLVHAGLEEGICALLGHPRICPHGKPIPSGSCCAEAEQSVGQTVIGLSEMRPGQRGTITHIRSDDPKKMNKLMAMGVLPGTAIELLRRTPSFVFQVGYSQFAVDEEVASAVFVRQMMPKA